LTLVPLLFLAASECVLRIAGYGHPTSFFLRTQINDQPVYVENADFGRRFFPVEMARSPSPLVFPADKATNTFRIFVLGESAALGDPEPAFGLGRNLEVLLRERYPDTRFEVINAAVTAINSHALLPIARECAVRQSDLWIIYMGNNEVVGPFGAGTVLGARAPPLFVARSTLAMKRLRLGQWLDAVLSPVSTRGSGSAKAWQGMQMFLDAQTRPSDPARRRTQAYFRRNLEDILEVARDHQIKVVLSTVASNLKDCAPFASLHAPGLSEADRNAWETFYKQGIALENSTNHAGALAQYEQAAKLDPDFAELQFRLGRCHLRLGDQSRSRACFELARDLDALAFRADTLINAAIREAASASKQQPLTLVDAAKDLALASSNAIPGTEYFFEHVHLNLEGNYRLARAIAEEATKLLPEAVTRRDRGTWLSAEACASNLCITVWDRYRLAQNVLQRLRQPPFTLQLDHEQRVRELSAELAQHRSAMTRTAAEQARELYRQALTNHPTDYYLHGNFAKFLEDTGNASAAVPQWKRVVELLPYHFGPYYYLGKALGRVGQYTEAETALRRTLALRPDAVDAMDELAQQLIRQKRPAEALPLLQEGLRLKPSEAKLHLHQADAFGALNRREEAIASLQRAVTARPDYWEARYLLGIEFALKERLPEAAEQFKEVVRLNPDHPQAHLNLGIALAKQNRFAEAIGQFRDTLRLDPTNKLAQEYLSKLKLTAP
jgi:tetratricopeptide (TPR) repeat protein